MLIDPEDAVRMLRDDWAGPHGAEMLAQELYSIFTSSAPSESTAPASFSDASGTSAPITVSVPSLEGTWPAIDFVGPQGQPAGSVAINNGVPQLQNAAGKPVSGGGGGAGTTALVGTVQSGGPGTGPYVVLANGVNINVYQLQIDSGSTIPSGTGVIVVKVGGTYYMQAPVWQ